MSIIKKKLDKGKNEQTMDYLKYNTSFYRIFLAIIKKICCCNFAGLVLLLPVTKEELVSIQSKIKLQQKPIV